MKILSKYTIWSGLNIKILFIYCFLYQIDYSSERKIYHERLPSTLSFRSLFWKEKRKFPSRFFPPPSALRSSFPPDNLSDDKRSKGKTFSRHYLNETFLICKDTRVSFFYYYYRTFLSSFLECFFFFEVVTSNQIHIPASFQKTP